jgi:Domain of unknown function (DUF4105)
MKRFLTQLVLLMTLNGSATILSTYSKVSVITCNPGPEPYAIFGHSAIRVSDSVSGIDIVFNYGTFDFDDPSFYRKFLGGRLIYFLSVSTFGSFLPEYQEGGRIVWEQVLKMTTTEKQAIYNRLLDNLKEQNRYYKYNFLYDNCSTRIGDKIQSIYGKSWVTLPPAGARSFRQQFGSTYSYNPWTGFGIDVCTGLPADKRPSPSENLFLPQNLFDALERAQIVDTTIVYDFTKPTKGEAIDWTSPLVVCWVLFAISVVILVVEIRLRRRLKVFDIALLTITGLAGLVMLFLWTLTDHRISRWNLNLLWASPLNLVALFSTRFKRFYFPFYSIVLGLLAVFMLIAPRFLDPAIFPLALALLTRTVNRSIRLTSLAFDVPNVGK